MSHQIRMDEIISQQQRRFEIHKPWFLQVSSAPLVRFIGESAERRLDKGALGFIVGSLPGELFDTHFQSRGKSTNVRYVDLEPMKVMEFSEEEKVMTWPKLFEKVKIISNVNLNIIDEGILIRLLPDCCYVTERNEDGSFSKSQRRYDLRVHHFEGYRPARLLVWKDEIT